MEENNKRRGPGKGAYIFTSLMTLVLVGIMFFAVEMPYNEESAKEVVGALCNCFTVPGVFVGGVGALSYVGRLGGFDGLTYAFKNFGLHTIFFTNPKKKRTESFYEYKQEKDERGRAWLPNMLFAGLGSLTIGIILMIVYLILP